MMKRLCSKIGKNLLIHILRERPTIGTKYYARGKDVVWNEKDPKKFRYIHFNFIYSFMNNGRLDEFFLLYIFVIQQQES